jgi:ribosome-associated toxin RatA of RatAB toxin-antitoxin module
MALLAPSSKAEGSFPCEPSLIFEMLTDYDTYCEWLPAISESKLLAKEGDLALAEIRYAHPFSDKLVFECIHDKNRSVLARVISGSLPVGKIEWTITGAGERSQVTVVIEGKPDWHWIRPGYRKLLSAQQYIAALQGQVAAYSSELVLSGENGETILDLMETSEGLVLVYRGQKYTFQAVPQRQQ